MSSFFLPRGESYCEKRRWRHNNYILIVGYSSTLYILGNRYLSLTTLVLSASLTPGHWPRTLGQSPQDSFMLFLTFTHMYIAIIKAITSRSTTRFNGFFWLAAQNRCKSTENNFFRIIYLP